MKNQLYIFNHFYRLRHDERRTYICSPHVSGTYELEHNVNGSWLSKIHPVYGMLFSFLCKPVSIEDLTEEVSYFFDISLPQAERLIIPFLNQKEPFYTEFSDVINQFPKNIIIPASSAFCKMKIYEPGQFQYNQVDIKRGRFYRGPISIVLMINNVCATNCIYCYADKKTKVNLLSFERLTQVIENARKLGVMEFLLTGGEFFLYSRWRDLLKVLAENDFTPLLISTKVPITEDDIRYLTNFNISLQLSLDSMEPLTLKNILGVKENYISAIREMVTYLEKYNITYKVATVVTKLNDNVDELEKIYNFLKNLKMITVWDIRIAFRSLYSRKDFNEIKARPFHIEIINTWIEKIKSISKLSINWDNKIVDRYFKSHIGSKGFIGNRCSANYSNMIILPDGKVTLCEQLYWNKNYIIGDLTNDSIEKVWNSLAALKLAFPKREDFSSKSVCYSCSIYDDCIKYQNRCIVDIIKGYGEENSDYPDPRCAKAPTFINELRISK